MIGLVLKSGCRVGHFFLDDKSLAPSNSRIILGCGATVAQRTLDPLIVVRVHASQLRPVNVADRESRSDEFDQAQNDALGFLFLAHVLLRGHVSFLRSMLALL